MSSPLKLKREQHPKFGTEIRELLSSPRETEQELGGFIASEIDALATKKAQGQQHPQEESFTNNDRLRGIGYLKFHCRLRGSDISVRVYFLVVDGVIWMLGLDKNKRRTPVTEAMKTTLENRAKEVKATAKTRGNP